MRWNRRVLQRGQPKRKDKHDWLVVHPKLNKVCRRTPLQCGRSGKEQRRNGGEI